MITALILINVEIGTEKEVLEMLRKMECVVEAFAVYGTYDIVAKVQTENLEKLNEIVTGKIRKKENIRATQTMVVVDEKSLGLEWIRT